MLFQVTDDCDALHVVAVLFQVTDDCDALHVVAVLFQVTVMHSMQAGYMDKAQKYTDKALMQIEKLKSG